MRRAPEQHIYQMRGIAPFSVVVGGLARFQRGLRAARGVRGQPCAVTWVLRDVETGEIVRVTQAAAKGALQAVGSLVSDTPLKDGGIYETLSVSAPVSPELRPEDAPRAPRSQRLGLARGTRVMTDRGEMAVERLSAGDRVVTRDHGIRPVAHVGRQTCVVEGEDAPVLVTAGTIHNERDLVLSADTRLVLKGAAALATYGAREVLVPARRLVDGKNILRTLGGQIEFFQVVLDRHEVIYAEAAAVESFMADAAGLLALDERNRAELTRAVPQAPEAFETSARQFVETRQ